MRKQKQAKHEGNPEKDKEFLKDLNDLMKQAAKLMLEQSSANLRLQEMQSQQTDLFEKVKLRILRNNHQNGKDAPMSDSEL